MGAQEVTGKIFNSRTLPKPVIPDSITSSNHLATTATTSPFSRPTHSHPFSSSTTSTTTNNNSYSSNASPPSRQDGSLELPKVKREPSPEVDGLHRSSQLSLAPLRTNGTPSSLLGLASVCSSRSPLPSVDSDTRTTTGRTSSVLKSRPYSPPNSPYPQAKRRTSSSSGENMDQSSYSSPRLGNRDTYDRRTNGHSAYNAVSRDRSGSNASTSGFNSTNGNVRPMQVDSPSPGVGHTVVPTTPRNGGSANAPNATDRLWANYRPRGGSFAALPSRDAPPPPSTLSNHSTLPNLGVPSPYGHKRPSPSNAGESEKEDMEDDSDPNGSLHRMSMGLGGKEDESFSSHREKRRVIEKKSRMRRVDALDHLRLVVSREYQNQHRTHGTGHPHGPSYNIDPLTQAPRKNCQADICFEAVEIIERMRADNDRLRHQNRELIERLTQATSTNNSNNNGNNNGNNQSHSHVGSHSHGHHSHSHGTHAPSGGPHGSPSGGGSGSGRTA